MRHAANEINLYIYIERWIVQKTWINEICEDNISMNFLEHNMEHTIDDSLVYQNSNYLFSDLSQGSLMAGVDHPPG